ncbi:LPXTG cell wall anchor domain-containing protein [Arthrobacter sp. ISL-28]|uniref:LPXTG cell wall anchor domain-containing protein n=1 Tax=Arthrobacter sp. ISL-28 TaxID=2819108 RepID=UPI001BE87BBB|nr:LPXTG cell wall anchor domain-containing protein [Arthrobacter sp. ISL-28]MBT2519680.1 LPXTG cell wall anchor domain-containing protein [Arthrobacter sp. ISL-28]
MKKSFAVIALAGSITLAGAVPALADHEAPAYPGGTTQGTVSDGTVAPGEVFTFSGTGFEPGEAITITVTLTSTPQASGGIGSGSASLAVPVKIVLPLAPQTFSTTADSSGAFAFPLTISEPGTYLLTAEGASGHTVTATVTVAGAAGDTDLATTGGNSGTGAPLANTGADQSLVLWSLVGAGAVAAGVTSVVVVRRRAKADTV